MYDEKETYIGETIGDTVRGFIVRINQYISDFKTRNFTCKFSINFSCGVKSNFPQETVFKLNRMLRLKKIDKLETEDH